MTKPPDDTWDAEARAQLVAVAAEHLPADVAIRWVALARPALRLRPAGPEDPVNARLGGMPSVPPGFEWPAWEGHGPLSFVAEVDLTTLTAAGLPDLGLPPRGRLLAFYFDGSYDDQASVVGTWDRESLAGARLVHLDDTGEPAVEAPVPLRVNRFRAQRLTGTPILTLPGFEHPLLEREFRAPGTGHREWMAHPVNSDALLDAVGALAGPGPHHQLGGWAAQIQRAPEYEVAETRLTEPFEYAGSDHVEEALLWSLILQVDSDDSAGMTWGDVGTLYWLRRGPGAREEFADVCFTSQCY